MALALSRAAGGVPEGESCVHAGLPLSPLASLRIQISLKYPVEQLLPPNTIKEFVVGSYTPVGCILAAGGGPDGEIGSHVEDPLSPLAPSRIQTSFTQGPGNPVPPPKIVMRLLVAS